MFGPGEGRPAPSLLADPRVEPGMRLYERGAYFEAHEAWEQSWREAEAGPFRVWIHGLIQLAAALHKLTVQRDVASGRSLLAKARAKLERVGSGYGGVDVGALLVAMARLDDDLTGARVRLDGLRGPDIRALPPDDGPPDDPAPSP